MELNKKNHYKALLINHKESEENAIEYMNSEELYENTRESLGELSSFDNHPADVATEVFMTEHAMGLKTMHENSIKDVEEAILRIDKDSFGTCLECHKTIDEERLEILPETKLCIDCARLMDKSIESAREAIKHRPPGYQEVSTKFGKKPVKDPLETRGKEQDRGEDVLNDLMNFGSAQSPTEKGNFKDFKEAYTSSSDEEGIVEEVDRISNEDYWSQLPG